METISISRIAGSLKWWQRRSRQRYSRLKGGATIHRKKTKTVRLGGGSPRRRAWRIKAASRKLKIVLLSPMKLLRKLENLYISVMLNLAGGNYGDGNTFGEKRIPQARHPRIAYSSTDFNDRLVLEIYKSLVASREMYNN